MSDNTTERQTLVEEGTEVSGTIRAKCKVVVRGTIEGELEAPSVDITDTGSVTGTLRAKVIRSQGAVAGTVEVETISIAGRVHSNTVIRAETLEVLLSSTPDRLEATFGDCVLEVGEMPSDQPQDDDAASTDETEASAGDQAESTDAPTEGKRGKKRRKKKGRGGDVSPSEPAPAGDGANDAKPDADATPGPDAKPDSVEGADAAGAESGDEKNSGDETPAADPAPAPV